MKDHLQRKLLEMWKAINVTLGYETLPENDRENSSFAQLNLPVAVLRVAGGAAVVLHVLVGEGEDALVLLVVSGGRQSGAL